MARPARSLVVVADDFGIGPETSRGIVELAGLGVVTGTVLLTNSPHAEDAVRRWRAASPDADLGWHPCLTMDSPLSRPEDVPSLVGPSGRMGPLRWFLTRLLTGRVRSEDIERELQAQFRRFHDLTGHAPPLVNAHHHVAAFPFVAGILRDVLRGQSPLPFLRRVREPWRQVLRLPGARLKRATLTAFGALPCVRQRRQGFAGADCVAGIGSPSAEPDFFTRWLRGSAGLVVELMCHPGWPDPTLPGRDRDSTPHSAAARVREREILARLDFRLECQRAGFRLTRPRELLGRGEKARVA
jgi:predicted glycoside hydrolase/deacetylase ChbG (UPF0249 family)